MEPGFSVWKTVPGKKPGQTKSEQVSRTYLARSAAEVFMEYAKRAEPKSEFFVRAVIDEA